MSTSVLPTMVGAVLVRAVERLEASGSETPRLDAEVLLAWVLGIDRSGMLTHPDALLSGGHVEHFDAALERRESGEPVAYIRGMKEFYGSIITVDPRVLVPRPDTETLVEVALERIRSDLTETVRPEDLGPYTVWDIGAIGTLFASTSAMPPRTLWRSRSSTSSRTGWPIRSRSRSALWMRPCRTLRVVWTW